MIPRLDKSLCGCSLYTGSLILSWLYTIGSLFGTVLFGIFGPLAISMVEDESYKHGETMQEQDERALMYAKAVYAVVLLMLIMGTFINGSLLYGVYKRNHCMMMPHLIFAGIGLCCSGLVNTIFIFVAFTSAPMFFQFFCYTLQNVIAAYFWLIIYSHFKIIKDEALQNTNSFNKL